ncbi:MAG: peptidyl-prolyl cis-trans isomerase SurA [Crocinitomicaceae bacterium]|jgi:peptidyl-prolyl cis-trans isomerase SurA
MRTLLPGLLIIAISLFQHANSQTKATIVSIVGKDTIFQSALEDSYNYYLASGYPDDGTMKCTILNLLINDAILLANAKDNIKVADDLIDAALNRRIETLIYGYSGKKAFEDATGKTEMEIRREYRPEIKRQLLLEMIRNEIWKEVAVRPEHVKEYFHSIPKDSLPYLTEEVELYHITIDPSFSNEAKAKAQEELMVIYKLATSGNMEFAELANEYTMDPFSAYGGSLGDFSRGTMIPEFEDVVFNLEEGEISPPFETVFGFQIAKLNSRLGDVVNVSHILIIPKKEIRDDQIAIAKLSRIKEAIMSDSISFENAVQKWSQDAYTKEIGGSLGNPITGALRVPLDLLEPDLMIKVTNMKEGGISQPLERLDPSSGFKTFHILYLKKRIPEHVVDLKDDYQKLADATRLDKQEMAMEQWIEKAKENTSIDIRDENCAKTLESGK